MNGIDWAGIGTGIAALVGGYITAKNARDAGKSNDKKSEFKLLFDQQQQSIKNLQDETDKLRKQVDKMQERIDNMTNENDKVKKLNSQLQDSNRALMEENGNLKQENKLLSENLDEAKATVDKLKQIKE